MWLLTPEMVEVDLKVLLCMLQNIVEVALTLNRLTCSICLEFEGVHPRGWIPTRHGALPSNVVLTGFPCTHKFSHTCGPVPSRILKVPHILIPFIVEDVEVVSIWRQDELPPEAIFSCHAYSINKFGSSVMENVKSCIITILRLVAFAIGEPVVLLRDNWAVMSKQSRRQRLDSLISVSFKLLCVIDISCRSSL